MDFRAIFMGILFALIWSSAFTSAKIIVAQAPPMAALAVRFLVSGCVALAIARALGQNFRLTAPQWKATIVFGLCQNALYLGLNFYAMQTIEASLASIIASSMPLIVAFAAWVFLRERMEWLGVLGLFMGIFGVCVIMLTRIEGGAQAQGVALCVIGAIALSVATLSMRNASTGGNLLVVVGLQMLVGALVLAVISLMTETIAVHMSASLLMAFLYTALVPGVLATWIWFKLVERIGAVRAATFHFLNPFFGVTIAAMVLGEHLEWSDLLGVCIIAAGILAVQISKTRSR